MIIEKPTTKLFCVRCKRHWSYRGNAIYYTICPQCHSSVNIRKYKTIVEEK